jgi:hypothetical protein
MEGSLPVCWGGRKRASLAGWQPNRAAPAEVYPRERAVDVGAMGQGSVVAEAMENWPVFRGSDRCFRASKTALAPLADKLSGVSANGAVMVGGSIDASGQLQAFRCTPANACRVPRQQHRQRAAAAGLRGLATVDFGIAGLLELLLVASLPLREPTLADEALEAWRVLLSFHAASSTWPSEFPSCGRSPSLMLGLAGVGHALLRAARPDIVRSVLLVSSSDPRP